MNIFLIMLVLIEATFILAAGSNPAAPIAWYIMGMNVTLGPSRIIQGPFGPRDSNSFLSGTFTDGSGSPFATVVNGGGENGLADSLGNFHIDARMTLSLANSSYAYLQFRGIGKFAESNMFYLTVETDSKEWGFLNSMFLYGPGLISGGFLTGSVYSNTKPPNLNLTHS